MRLSIFPIAPLALCISLVGCNWSQQEAPSTPTSVQPPPSPSSNPIADAPVSALGKAQKICGDPSPKDEKAYPVSFYPVFVTYSDKNLELVRKHFCEDAIKRFSEKLSKDVVQVGSFTSKEKAEKMKLALSSHLQGAEVGEPTVVQTLSKPTIPSAGKNIGVAARLTPQQVQELEKSVGAGKDFNNQVVVVLPSDIPSGFEVSSFRVYKTGIPKREFGGRYTINYKNKEGACFYVDGGIVSAQGDTPVTFEKTEPIPSLALGNLVLGIEKFDKDLNIRLVSLVPSNGLVKGKNLYYFGSNDANGCSVISKKDAVRIARSLQFLNP